jgi:dihydroxy-acid dehydratase
MTARGDDPNLDVTADDVLVLRNAGPKGAPGMPEAGYVPIPKKLARRREGHGAHFRCAHERHGVRHHRAAYHAGIRRRGAAGAGQTGDRITLDVPKRRLELHVDARTLAARKKAWKAPPPHPGSGRGYTGLFFKTVLQADEGVDFDFLGPEK